MFRFTFTFGLPTHKSETPSSLVQPALADAMKTVGNQTRDG